jgi:hypothetical protein
VFGKSTSRAGVLGESTSQAGVGGQSSSGSGVVGYSISGDGLHGYSVTSHGVYGWSSSFDGIFGASGSGGYAGHFDGRLKTTGTFTGSWNDALVYFENLNSGAGSSPALRVVANGNAPYGALSVSTQGTGLIAQFGNASSFVSALDANGNWSATSFTPSSDRNLKENFSQVDPQEVLEKVVVLPITRWNFKSDSATRHLGPRRGTPRLSPSSKLWLTLDTW